MGDQARPETHALRTGVWAVTYTTIETIKNLLDIPTDDMTQDDYLMSLVNSAAQRIDQHCDRNFIVATDTETVRVFHGEDGPPYQVDDMVAMPSVVEYGKTPMGPWTDLPDGWWVEPLNPDPIHDDTYDPPRMPYDWIATTKHAAFIRVTADWGWPIVPPDVARASLRLVHRYYALPGAPLGASAAQTEVGPIFIRARDQDVATLLRPYRKTADSLL